MFCFFFPRLFEVDFIIGSKKNKPQQLGLKSAVFIRPLPGQSALLRSKSRLRASSGQNGNIITLEEPAEPTPAQGETAAWRGSECISGQIDVIIFDLLTESVQSLSQR